MSPALKNLLLLTTAILALAGGYWVAQSLRPPEKVTALASGGGEMIDFTLPDLNGKNRSLNEWRGKVVVLNFWATWCPPCREEIPLFSEMQKRHAAEGLQLVGVAVDNKTNVMTYRHSVNINYPILIGNEEETMQIMARYGNHMGSLPYTVIIDRNGVIVVRKLGAFNRTELKDLLEPLLTPPAASSKKSF